MTNDQREGYDIIINGECRLFAEMELSAFASAGFHKEHFPQNKVQIRRRADGTLLTVLGHAKIEVSPGS